MQGIRIKNLFGHFNYEILLSEERMTIITGPNGYGKSTIIQCLNALANSNVEYFSELDFEQIEILSDDGDNNFLIEKSRDMLNIGDISIKRHIISYAKRFSQHKRNLKMLDEEGQETLAEYSKVLECMKQAVGEVCYIKEQRLIFENVKRVRRAGDIEYHREVELVQAVEEIPNKLKFQIEKASMMYSNVASELDSTYPERLFSQQEGISHEEFDRNIGEMQNKVEKLNKYGISNLKKLNNIKFKKEDARALKIYFEDFDRKYQVYSSLIEKLDMFTKIVNKRFQFKEIKVSNEKGLEIIDRSNEKEVEIIEKPERTINLLKLSSGEKETLVLFYQLIFEVPEQVLLLVDEPEISLHIAWQRMFIEDLKIIAGSKGSNVIVATHSPQIVNGNWNIQRDLGEMHKDGLNQEK